MANILFKRGTTAKNDNYIGQLGEITIDSELHNFRIHDGTTLGGHVVKNAVEMQAIIDALGIADINGLQDYLDTLASKSVRILAGDGLVHSDGSATDLSGGDVTIELGVPDTITGTTTNLATVDGHTHEIFVTGGDVEFDNSVTGLTATTVQDAIDEHVTDTTNPHQVTKAQTGLGNVDNYSTATDVESIAATSRERFQTPIGTKEFIENGDYIIDGGTF